ncbi:MAG: hypothetical protein MUD01_14780 [Chloroflexaceae bacterium]|jgi:hypothetical protein|nr:hypothetical protein [Chloroflexaceae bacterium]
MQRYGERSADVSPLQGVLRRAMFRDGQWHDMAIYGLLRAEWSQGNTSV